MAIPKFNVKIFSDNVCPWCFVGKRNLESAMKQFSEIETSGAEKSPPVFNLKWSPFFLNTDFPDTSEEPIKEYLDRKYGPGYGTRAAAALEKAGQSTGINFNSDRKIHNTLRSHRMVRLANQQGKEGDMIEQLFHAYFEEAKDLSNFDVLLEIAQKARVECTKEFLEGKEGKEEVLHEYEKIKHSGISGVPYYVVSREGSKATVPLSGAQPPQAFIEAFRALS